MHFINIYTPQAAMEGDTPLAAKCCRMREGKGGGERMIPPALRNCWLMRPVAVYFQHLMLILLSSVILLSSPAATKVDVWEMYMVEESVINITLQFHHAAARGVPTNPYTEESVHVIHWRIGS